ncbi:unnamed protein product [Prunus armeniaca]|uniref:Uncharacterized protein n=1 Tax=Prunus armeniaca TaxID=36596 RepID=A0A6J5X1S9_PRUAR|nr:unnamed protein product [Prunus armeniaca]
MEESPKFKPQTLSQSSSRRRRTSTDSNSPEFEFWMVRNPSCPQPNLLSADELFVDGVLLPLHLLPNQPDPPDPNPQPISEQPVPDSETVSEPAVPDPEQEPSPGPELSTAPVLTASKRWRDIFKKGEKKTVKGDENDKEKDKKKERKGGTGASSAELNINIWPFSRSRSAGNAYTRPKPPFGSPATRKVNSAPCSRSNSTGESKSRKWPPASPGRPGVHLGRSSPVWQVRRGSSVAVKSSLEPHVRNAEKATKKEVPESRRSKNTTVVAGAGGAKGRVLNLNVPMCIGYRSHLSCRSDENSAVGVAGGGGSGSRNRGGGGGHGGDSGVGGNLFNLRSLFTKKVY